MRTRTHGTLALLLVTLAAAPIARAELAEGEPAYCDPKTFKSREIPIDSEGLIREHLFQLGSVKVLGLALLGSHTSRMQEVARELGQVGPEERYCTWYFNQGDDSAEEAFNQFYVGNPIFMSSDKAAREFIGKLGPIFSENATSMLGCAERYGYIAMGCNSQMHRGPTVFGMMLAYSGCGAENSRKIANKIWGGNFVRDKVRRKVNQAAHDLGLAQPDRSARLRALFSDTTGQ